MDAINEVLTRGVDKIYPTKEALEKVLRSGKKLRLYQGFDPSGNRLHIGHAVGLKKLRQFQDLGHKVIFLIGDFTGMIGDPSGKKDARQPLTKEQVLENAQSYKNQASRILRFDGDNPVEIMFNSSWNANLTFEDVLRLASHFTAQQMLERDMFQERIKEGRDISLVEFLYPVMVAYDAVMMDVDLEIGGADQTFNMLTGRRLMRQIKQKEKFVLTVPLLTDSHGKKIGKTEGNVIGITDTPNELFGKIMSLPDDVIVKGFELLTDLPMDEIRGLELEMKKVDINPITLKKRLAHTLVFQYHSKPDADHAQTYFEQTIQNKELPKQVQEVTIDSDKKTVALAILASGLAESMSDVKRVAEQGGLYVNNKRVARDQLEKKLEEGAIIRRGAHRLVKIRYK